MTSRGKKASARQARREAAIAKRRRRRIITISAVAAVVVAMVVFAVTQPEPIELANVETFADMGGGHLSQGETPPEYNSSPPTSGRHSPDAAPCGIYETEIPDPLQIHNLEHGTVVIQYQPGLPEVEIAALQGYGRSKSSHILVAPNSSLTDPVVVTTWTRMLRLDSADLDTIEVYYDRFVRTGPEVGVPCGFAVDEAI
jgi:hypothetical protein